MNKHLLSLFGCSSLALILLACGPSSSGGGAGGGGSGGEATSVSSSSSAGSGGEGGSGCDTACLHCSEVRPGHPEDVDRLCLRSRILWDAQNACLCNIDSMPPPGEGICSGPCTYYPDVNHPEHTWCQDLTPVPECYACRFRNEIGCGPKAMACENDIAP